MFRTYSPTTLPGTETSKTLQELGSNVFCYYTNWSQYRANAIFFPEDLDPSLCTHLIYAFAKIIETDESNEIDVKSPDGTQPATMTPLASTTPFATVPPSTESPAKQGWGLGPTEWNDIGDQWTYGGGLYARLNRLKDSNPGLKVSRIYFDINPGQILYHINPALDFDKCGWRKP